MMVVVLAQDHKELDITVRSLDGGKGVLDVEITQGKDNILIEDTQIPVLVRALTSFYSLRKQADVIIDDSDTFLNL